MTLDSTNEGKETTTLRPIIGITCYLERARWGPWDKPAALVPWTYVRAVEASGGRALLIPPSLDGVEETLGVFDGLVLSGGSDVDPSLYGAAPHVETKDIRPDRDRAELRLLEASLERGVPSLAICRGMEIMNIARGGDLEQHLPDKGGGETHKESPGNFSKHEVEVLAGSRVAGMVRSGSMVCSHHHQAPERLGEGLSRVAWAPDSTTEAIEDQSLDFAIGVLWHPEEGDDLFLFEQLVQAATEYVRARTSTARL